MAPTQQQQQQRQRQASPPSQPPHNADSTGPPLQHESTIPDFTHLVVLDFEATCLEDKRINPQEIIEFPMAVLEIASGSTTAEFHEYVRPVAHPLLSPFCTGLTGIQQETVEAGDTFAGVFARAQAFLHRAGLTPGNAVIVTCGDWDLRTALVGQLKYSVQQQGGQGSGVHVPSMFRRWINIKGPFGRLYKVKARGMTSMLDHLGIALEGRHHSGIDDVRNTARVAVRMLRDGWVPCEADVAQR